MKGTTIIPILKRVLNDLGIEPKRVKLEWISASEGRKFLKVLDEFIDEARKLGPLKIE